MVQESPSLQEPGRRAEAGKGLSPPTSQILKVLLWSWGFPPLFLVKAGSAGATAWASVFLPRDCLMLAGAGGAPQKPQKDAISLAGSH